jgi:hypothetical protein
MTTMQPRNMIWLGFFLVLAGFVLPMLMVLRVIQPTFAVSFLSFAASIAGLVLGLIGAAYYARSGKR